ncbi:STOP protein (macronuclear) [Tetrahymena thermophila SB210]|uniref:STOP protein n=1 Tax=Tetrahymena thermophila (strain SB210) TaxID=312017 RepID=Q24BQ1_TETTS|nr:STOP protein [Tetrahymena thermophila SB210]EAS05192.2 STOP protein [Tetrahymena thermophila SB210]|eukprot:XP_001025437.2 STOP protein [Tetrahymena thermophila SB210]
MLSVASPSFNRHKGQEEAKHPFSSQKSEQSLSKGYQQSSQIVSTQFSNQNSQQKENELEQRIKKFQSSLLKIKGSDVPQQNQVLHSPLFKKKSGSNMSQISPNSTNTVSLLSSQRAKSQFESQQEQSNSIKLRRIVKNLKGELLEQKEVTVKKDNNHVYQSVYSQSQLASTQKNLINDSYNPRGLKSLGNKVNSFATLQEYNNSLDFTNPNYSLVNEKLVSPQVKYNLKLLKNSLNSNTYDQVLNDLVQNKMKVKRSFSNNLIKKKFLKPIKKEENSITAAVADSKVNVNNSIIVSKDTKRNVNRSISQEHIIKNEKMTENDQHKENNILHNSHLELQEQNQAEVSDFENLLTEVKQEEKISQINDEEVISEYQVKLSNKNFTDKQSEQQYSPSQVRYSQENLTESTLSHEQEMIQYLMQTQPNYFDHKAGKCLCSLCSCGSCITKCKQLSQYLDTNLKQSWTSTYRQAFKQRANDIDSKSIDSLNQLKMQYKSQLDGQKELYCSTTKNDYKMRLSLEDPFKIKQKTYTENKAPISCLSSYNSQFVNWGIPSVNLIKQSQQKTVLDKLPFNHITTYEQNFQKKFDATPSKKCVPKNMNPLPNIGIFIGESTTQRYFDEKKNNFFQLPTKRQHSPPDQTPSYSGQFKSETQKAFEGATEKCLAKEILKKKLIEKLQNKILDKSRYYQGKKEI